MRIILIIAALLAVSSCRTPLPPCEGTEEQIYRCKSLRIQEEQANRLRQMQIQQNQLIWNDFNKKHVNNPQSY
jgi:hypothetical protein